MLQQGKVGMLSLTLCLSTQVEITLLFQRQWSLFNPISFFLRTEEFIRVWGFPVCGHLDVNTAAIRNQSQRYNSFFYFLGGFFNVYQGEYMKLNQWTQQCKLIEQIFYSLMPEHQVSINNLAKVHAVPSSKEIKSANCCFCASFATNFSCMQHWICSCNGWGICPICQGAFLKWYFKYLHNTFIKKFHRPSLFQLLRP